MTIVYKPKTNLPDTQYRCLDRFIVRTRPSWCVAFGAISNLSTLMSLPPRPLYYPALKHAHSPFARERPGMDTWPHGDCPAYSHGIPKRLNS